MRTYAVVFATVFMAELGDKTQLATLFFAMNPGASRVGVFVAAALALIASTLAAVLVGARLGEWVAPQHLKLIAGAAFIALGLWMLTGRS